MPLSRLSPRSSRTGLARQKAASSKLNDSQKHLHLWAAIRKTREELELWQAQIDQVETLFNQHIVPREQSLTRVVINVTEQLIQHFSNGPLDIPGRSLLGLWVTDNLSSLHNHPFADSIRTSKLNATWMELLNQDGPVENQLARLARQRDFKSDAGHTASEDSASQPHDKQDHAKSTANEQRNQVNDECAAPGNEQHDQVNDEYAAPGVEGVIDSLEDKLSVDKLFRQLATVLHPDREQDEQAKSAKHVLMSECLEARKNNDINALLTLYCEHVGDLPDDLNNNSHAELIDALETQLKDLQIELRHKRFGNPLKNMIVERYSSSTTADCERRIQSHAQSLDKEIEAARILVSQLDDHEGLLDALDTRRALEQDRMFINEMTGY